MDLSYQKAMALLFRWFRVTFQRRMFALKFEVAGVCPTMVGVDIKEMANMRLQGLRDKYLCMYASIPSYFGSFILQG